METIFNVSFLALILIILLKFQWRLVLIMSTFSVNTNEYMPRNSLNFPADLCTKFQWWIFPNVFSYSHQSISRNSLMFSLISVLNSNGAISLSPFLSLFTLVACHPLQCLESLVNYRCLIFSWTRKSVSHNTLYNLINSTLNCPIFIFLQFSTLVSLHSISPITSKACILSTVITKTSFSRCLHSFFFIETPFRDLFYILSTSMSSCLFTYFLTGTRLRDLYTM